MIEKRLSAGEFFSCWEKTETFDGSDAKKYSVKACAETGCSY